MAQRFVENEYKIVEFEEKADIYIVNTCTVTNMSDKKSRQILRRTKQTNPKSILVVTGCYAQIAKEELSKIEEIDIILGNNEKSDLINYVEQFIKNNKKIEKTSDVMHQCEFIDFGNTLYTEKTRVVVKIQDGCDRFCSYCIIPYARGHIRSRKMQSIINEIEEISKKRNKRNCYNRNTYSFIWKRF